MALAPQVSNPGTQGQNARYNIRGLTQVRPGVYSDGTYMYDSNGLSLNRPDTYVAGLPAANNNGPGGPGVGSGIGAGGGNALYSSAVNSPWYQQALAATRALDAAAAASRKSGVQQALIQFGLVPEGFNDQYGDVDATTRSLAEANTASGISLYSRLKQALADAQRDSSRRLAARGLRRSGARGYQMRRNQLGYDQSYSDAVSKLLSGVSSLYSNYANSTYQSQMNLAQALANAIGNMSSWASPSASSWSAAPSSSSSSSSGGGATYGTPSTYYGPAPGTPGGGYTSGQKPLLMPEGL